MKLKSWYLCKFPPLLDEEKLVVFIAAACNVCKVEFWTRDFLINDHLIVKMSVEVDDC